MAGTRRDLTVVMNAIIKMDGQQKIKELKRLVSSLEDDVNEYRSAWESALERVEDLERTLSRVKNLSGMDVMERELQQFKDTAERSVREFENFLKVVNLNDFDFKRQKGVQELFDQIKRGTITSGQAIQEFKVRFQSLLEENYSKSGGVFDQAAVQNFTTTLEVMSSRLDTVAQKIAKIETEGVNVANGSGGGTGTVGNLAEQFDKIAMTAERMSDQAHSAVANVLELVQAINSYASADTANLLAVSRAFEGIANIGQGSFSEKSVNNLINLAKQISKLNENGNFKFSFNLEGLKDFKVSSTIHHLSDFLATLNNEQISSLERLSRINLSNFHQDNLKVSKASFDHLIELINALANNPIQTTSISAAMDKASEAADRAEREYIEEAEAIHQVDAAFQETAKATDVVEAELRDTANAVSQTDAAFENHKDVVVTTAAEEVKAVEVSAEQIINAEREKARIIEEEEQRIRAAIEKSYRTSELEAKLLPKDWKLLRDAADGTIGGGFLDYRGEHKGLDAFRAYLENFYTSITQLDRVLKYFDTLQGSPVLQFLESANDKLATLRDYINGDWTNSGPALLMKLFVQYGKELREFGWFQGSTSDFLSQYPFVDPENFRRMMRGNDYNFGALTSYVGTLDLDHFNLNAITEYEGVIRRIAEEIAETKQLEAAATQQVIELTANEVTAVQESASTASNAAEKRITAVQLLIAMLNQQRKAAMDAAQAEQLYQNSLQSTALVPRTAGALAEEQSQLQNLNRGYLEHVPAARAAAEAENEKAGASRNVTGAIDAEISEVREATSAEEQHTKALGTTSAALLEAAKTESRAAEEANRFREILLGMIQAQQNGVNTANRYAQAMLQIINACRQLGIATGNIPLLSGAVGGRGGEFESYRDIILETARAGEQHSRAEEMMARAIEGTFSAVNGSSTALTVYHGALVETTSAEVANTEATNASKEAKQQETEATKAQADAKRDAAEAEREEIAAQRQKNTMLRQLNTMLVQCEAAQRKYAAAAKLGIAKDDYSKLQGYVTQIRQMENALRSGGSTAKDLSGDFDRLRLSISDTTTALKTNTNLIGRWATTGMQQLKSRLTYSFGLAAMVYKAANEIKKMISTAVELDSAMNQLQIVTRSSGAEMDTYAKRVSSMAKETAQATKDLIDATTVYARLGYSMDESASLAKYTAMLQGVGNIEASAAQDAMTAILKAFNKNVEDAEDIMNKMVVVGKELPKTVVTQFQ